MKDNRQNLFTNPTKKQVLYFFILWLAGIVLLLLATTDLFTESPFQRSNAGLGLIVFSSTISLVSVASKYYKTKRQQDAVKG
jgi:hypothetical protein